MFRRHSDRTLRRWLETGKPRRIARLIETDSKLADRLDSLTTLQPGEVDELANTVAPSKAFAERVVVGVQERRDGQRTASVVADLVGLGFHVGRALLNQAPLPGSEDGGTTKGDDNGNADKA